MVRFVVDQGKNEQMAKKKPIHRAFARPSKPFAQGIAMLH